MAVCPSWTSSPVTAAPRRRGPRRPRRVAQVTLSRLPAAWGCTCRRERSETNTPMPCLLCPRGPSCPASAARRPKGARVVQALLRAGCAPDPTRGLSPAPVLCSAPDPVSGAGPRYPRSSNAGRAEECGPSWICARQGGICGPRAESSRPGLMTRSGLSPRAPTGPGHRRRAHVTGRATPPPPSGLLLRTRPQARSPTVSSWRPAAATCRRTAVGRRPREPRGTS